MSTFIACKEARRLTADDYNKGYLTLLAKLATVGEVTESQFAQQLECMQGKEDVYSVLVIEDQTKTRILATGTVFVEHKFIHACSKVGHIEDVVVLPEARGQGLGLRIVNALMEEANERQCYKVILDCDEANVGFYEKAGLVRKEVQMAKYF